MVHIKQTCSNWSFLRAVYGSELNHCSKIFCQIHKLSKTKPSMKAESPRMQKQLLIHEISKIVLNNLMITINVSICRYEEHLYIFIMHQKLSNATIIAFPENCLFRELLSWSPHVVAFCGDCAFLIHSQPFLHSHLSDIFVIFKAAFFKNARNAASRNLAIWKQLRKMPMVVPETL